jgi:hypothetical protein
MNPGGGFRLYDRESAFSSPRRDWDSRKCSVIDAEKQAVTFRISGLSVGNDQ